MTRDHKAALIHIRMSPQLRDALRRAADGAGCSMNSYAVQVLATATGDPAAFRATVDAANESSRPKPPWVHKAARQEFMFAMVEEIGWAEAGALVRRYDTEDPDFFLAWKDRRDREAEAG
jgi:hypothetical protein